MQPCGACLKKQFWIEGVQKLTLLLTLISSDDPLKSVDVQWWQFTPEVWVSGTKVAESFDLDEWMDHSVTFIADHVMILYFFLISPDIDGNLLFCD